MASKWLENGLSKTFGFRMLFGFPSSFFEPPLYWTFENQTPSKFRLQWGSKFQTSLVFKWSKRGWMPNGLVFECHLITGTAQPFEYQTNRHHLVFFYVLVGYLNGRSSTCANGPGPIIQIPDTDPVFIFGPNFKQCLKVWMTLWYSNGKITWPSCPFKINTTLLDLFGIWITTEAWL